MKIASAKVNFNGTVKEIIAEVVGILSDAERKIWHDMGYILLPQTYLILDYEHGGVEFRGIFTENECCVSQ